MHTDEEIHAWAREQYVNSDLSYASLAPLVNAHFGINLSHETLKKWGRAEGWGIERTLVVADRIKEDGPRLQALKERAFKWALDKDISARDFQALTSAYHNLTKTENLIPLSRGGETKVDDLLED